LNDGRQKPRAVMPKENGYPCMILSPEHFENKRLIHIFRTGTIITCLHTFPLCHFDLREKSFL